MMVLEASESLGRNDPRRKDKSKFDSRIELWNFLEKQSYGYGFSRKNLFIELNPLKMTCTALVNVLRLLTM
ncbi:hypothetical protein VNO77_20635 [Canavalia gladiata]|uniref:Uncharacterized protein n=1 Tax=Canavalia gladiata TaxID=3824 RepID=A0AAN9QLL1_CANGL